MVQEPKRISLVSELDGALASTSARFGPGTGTILRRLVNYHNIWGSFSVEPQVADANSNGWWILWLKSDTNNADPLWTLAQVDGGDFNMLVIACGTWVASNQHPFTSDPIHLNSSRNLVANQELVLTCFQNGITTGTSLVNVMLCAGLSVK